MQVGKAKQNRRIYIIHVYQQENDSERITKQWDIDDTYSPEWGGNTKELKLKAQATLQP